MKRRTDKPLRRALYLLLGILFFATGVIGVFLPVLANNAFYAAGPVGLFQQLANTS